MFVGRILYVLGIAFILFSIVVFIMIPFANSNGDLTIPFFALLNGFIAMGVGDLVIDLNHKQRHEKMNKD
ncbi:hypothetical protein [Tuberibacillus sp. Marseille-P3662]|uniref:hypothetical protein n=1 Tax=Tuberibacillus sp. Marseille-P3662 TaxID=1965358 RepID=UPI000A1CB671|nr:hypothetical protein [Tuberibacillus sp. Marseille-P3662]